MISFTEIVKYFCKPTILSSDTAKWQVFDCCQDPRAQEQARLELPLSSSQPPLEVNSNYFLLLSHNKINYIKKTPQWNKILSNFLLEKDAFRIHNLIESKSFL